MSRSLRSTAAPPKKPVVSPVAPCDVASLLPLMSLRLFSMTSVMVLSALANVHAGPRVSQAAAATVTPDIVYRSDETDATAQGLSDQPQFSGCGYLYNGANNELGSGTAIAANWVLTAKHVVTGYTTATFHAANGQVIVRHRVHR